MYILKDDLPLSVMNGLDMIQIYRQPGMRGTRHVINVSDLTETRLGNFAMERMMLPEQDSDIYRACRDFNSKGMTLHELRQRLVSIWYRIGLLGIKVASKEHVLWPYRGDRAVSVDELLPTTKLHMHKFAIRALGIIETSSESGPHNEATSIYGGDAPSDESDA